LSLLRVALLLEKPPNLDLEILVWLEMLQLDVLVAAACRIDVYMYCKWRRFHNPSGSDIQKRRHPTVTPQCPSCLDVFQCNRR
jgi:hypothetical protein